MYACMYTCIIILTEINTFEHLGIGRDHSRGSGVIDIGGGGSGAAGDRNHAELGG